MRMKLSDLLEEMEKFHGGLTLWQKNTMDIILRAKNKSVDDCVVMTEQELIDHGKIFPDIK